MHVSDTVEIKNSQKGSLISIVDHIRFHDLNST